MQPTPSNYLSFAEMTPDTQGSLHRPSLWVRLSLNRFGLLLSLASVLLCAIGAIVLWVASAPVKITVAVPAWAGMLWTARRAVLVLARQGERLALYQKLLISIARSGYDERLFTFTCHDPCSRLVTTEVHCQIGFRSRARHVIRRFRANSPPLQFSHGPLISALAQAGEIDPQEVEALLVERSDASSAQRPTRIRS